MVFAFGKARFFRILLKNNALIAGGQTLEFDVELRYAGTVEQGGKTFDKIDTKATKVTYALDPNTSSPVKVPKSDLKIEKSAVGDCTLGGDPASPMVTCTYALVLTNTGPDDFDGPVEVGARSTA